MCFKTGGHPIRFSFRVIRTQNNVTAPWIFWFKMPKLPSSFMLDNQNIKQKPIPSCIYLSNVLSQLTSVTTTVATAASSSSASAFILLFVLYGTTQEASTLAFSFLFWFVSQQLHFNLNPTTCPCTCAWYFLSTFNFHFFTFYLIDKSSQDLNDILKC